MPHAMSKKPTMKPRAFREIAERHGLREVDLSWLLGVGVRHVRAWGAGEYAIPQYAALLMRAYDGGLIGDAWVADATGRRRPA